MAESADTEDLYAPPREDAPPPPPPVQDQPPAPISPVLVGFLTLSATTFGCGLLNYAAMGIWFETTPKGGGFLSGLGEAIVAFMSWAALTGFHVLSGLGFAAGILGRQGKVSGAGWGIALVLGTGALLVCAIPEPSRGYYWLARAGLGALAGALGAAMTLALLRYARRQWIGAAPPDPWMVDTK